MSTDKSLKHLKSKDKFLIANVSNYFEKHTGRGSSSYIQQGQQKNRFPSTKRTTRNRTLSSPQRYKPVDEFDEAVIRKKVQGFYTHRHQLPTINYL